MRIGLRLKASKWRGNMNWKTEKPGAVNIKKHHSQQLSVRNNAHGKVHEGSIRKVWLQKWLAKATRLLENVQNIDTQTFNIASVVMQTQVDIFEVLMDLVIIDVPSPRSVHVRNI